MAPRKTISDHGLSKCVSMLGLTGGEDLVRFVFRQPCFVFSAFRESLAFREIAHPLSEILDIAAPRFREALDLGGPK